MKRSWALVVWVLVAGCTVVTRSGGRRSAEADAHDAEGAIVLNGERVEVHWSDGDSFSFKTGKYTGQGTRLVGYNTLEAFGPVHRWGAWSREELFTLAKQGSSIAASKEWECTTSGDEDAYKRVLVDCPALAMEMVKRGHGLAYAVRGKPTVLLLDAMHQAQRARRGVWEKGVPKGLITSLHSFAENTDERFTTSSNRVLDTYTGEATLRKHSDVYQTCEEVCLRTGDDFSCMVYVPFAQRYKNQPACLTGE